MARYIEVEQRDLQKLFDAISYVVDRYSGKDNAMCEFLLESLNEVKDHVENESLGGGHDTALEIERVLDYFGGVDGQKGDPPRT